MKQSKAEQLERLMEQPIPKRRVGIVKLQMVKEGTLYGGMHRLGSAEQAAAFVRPLFEKADREMMVVMSLSGTLEPLAVEIAAVGGMSSCPVDVKNLFKHALLNNASYLMCFHNHPSGLADPSREDGEITEQISAAGEILGIPLVDHIILGEAFYSFREHGKLPIRGTEKVA